MLCVSGVYLRGITKLLFSILHTHVSRLKFALLVDLILGDYKAYSRTGLATLYAHVVSRCHNFILQLMFIFYAKIGTESQQNAQITFVRETSVPTAFLCLGSSDAFLPAILCRRWARALFCTYYFHPELHTHPPTHLPSLCPPSNSPFCKQRNV